MDWDQPGATFWFEPGIHTLGSGEFGQIIPGDDTTFIGGPGAVIDGQNDNLYAFTQHARNVRIAFLTIQNFGTGESNNNEGVVNHDAGDGWTIERNLVTDNDGAGVFVGDGSTVKQNCLKNNGQYGFSAYEPDGVTNITIEGNEIAGNNTDDWETLVAGCGCSGGAKFWDVQGAVVRDNWVHDNRGAGLWADYNNRDFLIEGNYINDNHGEGDLVRGFLQRHDPRKHTRAQRAGEGEGVRRPRRWVPGSGCLHLRVRRRRTGPRPAGDRGPRQRVPGQLVGCDGLGERGPILR